MPDSARQVRPCAVSKEDTSAALGAAWARIARSFGKGAFADVLRCDVKTVNRAICGETVPELHTAFASLSADPSALDEVAEIYGVEIRPREADPSSDFGTIADLSTLAGQWVRFMEDGKRDHRETLELADMIRPLVAHLLSIVAEADRIRGIVR